MDKNHQYVAGIKSGQHGVLRINASSYSDTNVALNSEDMKKDRGN